MPLKTDLNQIGVAVFVVDVEPDGFRVFGINDVASRETGIAREAIAGRTFAEGFPADLAKEMTERYAACVRRRVCCEFEEKARFSERERWYRTTLTPFLGPDGSVIRIMAFSQDITANKKLQLQLQEFAFQDVLTGMANRRAFDRTVENAIAEASYSGAGFALAVVDLNNLKAINDEHGHRIGDAVIRAAGLMLSDMLERHELAARVGGDEFYLLLHTPDQKVLDERVRRIRNLPTHIAAENSFPLRLSFSMGAAMWFPGLDPHDVLSQADSRMYVDKIAHRRLRFPLRTSA